MNTAHGISTADSTHRNNSTDQNIRPSIVKDDNSNVLTTFCGENYATHQTSLETSY
jgi:hypothetical protein